MGILTENLIDKKGEKKFFPERTETRRGRNSPGFVLSKKRLKPFQAINQYEIVGYLIPIQEEITIFCTSEVPS